jgi:hypothetical protein
MNSLKLFAALFYFSICSVNAQQWVWAYSSGLYHGIDLTTDQHGNVTTLVSGMGNYETIPMPANSNIVIAQYNSKAGIKWAYGMSGVQPAKICTDSAGDFYITGTTVGKAAFYGANSTASLYTPGNHLQGFLAKYSSAGAVLWAFTFGDTAYTNEGISVKCDKKGNVFVLAYAAHSLSQYGPSIGNCIIKKFNPQGSLIWEDDSKWAHEVYGVDIDVDGHGSVIVLGEFSDTATFQNQTITGSKTSIFISKYNANGTLEWLKRQSTGRAFGLAVNSQGEIFTVFKSARPCTVDGIYIPINPSFPGIPAMLLSKSDSIGNALWVSTGENLQPRDIDLGKGRIIVSGWYKEQAIFNGPNSQVLNTIKKSEIFTACYSSLTGDVMWALSPEEGEGTYNESRGVSCDPSGGIWVTGKIESNTKFGEYDIQLKNGPSSGHFLAKIDIEALDVGVTGNTFANSEFQIYPSPTRQYLNILYINNSELKVQSRIYNILGVEICNVNLDLTAGNNSYLFDLRSQPPGIYFITITSEQGTVTKKFLKE